MTMVDDRVSASDGSSGSPGVEFGRDRRRPRRGTGRGRSLPRRSCRADARPRGTRREAARRVTGHGVRASPRTRPLVAVRAPSGGRDAPLSSCSVISWQTFPANAGRRAGTAPARPVGRLSREEPGSSPAPSGTLGMAASGFSRPCSALAAAARDRRSPVGGGGERTRPRLRSSPPGGRRRARNRLVPVERNGPLPFGSNGARRAVAGPSCARAAERGTIQRLCSRLGLT